MPIGPADRPGDSQAERDDGCLVLPHPAETGWVGRVGAATRPLSAEEHTVPDIQATAVDLDLDVTIVVAAPPAAALLGSTDDGCDTRTDGDC